MSSVTEVSKELTLDLSDIPRNKVKEAKEEVRAYLIDEILRSVEQGVSPVEGEGRFRILTPDYAREEKGGNRTANMELEGDMLNALTSKNKRGDKIEVGIYGANAPKADGHNQISGEAKAWASRTGRSKYKRRFIPDERQTFSKKIMDGVDDILDEYRVEGVEVGQVESTVTTEETTQVTVSDLFSDRAIDALLKDALKRRG